ncbi:unnamed protein product [Prunus armeniaca]|uniref:Uncharacterized protein n=1 Tax=Prunus armeniaca TaxID=36596 RepID=A0A6J5TIL4_PRUAR|nr:unnamed protein product [Prunus armeniaca]
MKFFFQYVKNPSQAMSVSLRFSGKQAQVEVQIWEKMGNLIWGFQIWEKKE